MASPEDIATVRANTDEPTQDNFTDQVISDLVDVEGVLGASATIWDRKAGMVANLVDVTEAGASHKFSDMSKNYLAMSKSFRTQADAGTPADTSGRVRVRKIVRT